MELYVLFIILEKENKEKSSSYVFNKNNTLYLISVISYNEVHRENKYYIRQ